MIYFCNISDPGTLSGGLRPRLLRKGGSEEGREEGVCRRHKTGRDIRRQETR